MFRRIYRQRRHAYIATVLIALGLFLKAQPVAPDALGLLFFNSDWATCALFAPKNPPRSFGRRWL